MRPADLRNLTWREVLTHLTEDLGRVHLAWQAHGPGTTRQVAQKSGISLFTFRPRTTDLYKLGLVVLVDTEHAQGIYAARTREEAEISRAWTQRADFRRTESALRRAEVPPRRDEGGPAPERVGFITVDEAIASLSPAERRALGARLMGESAHGRHRPDDAATAQLDLLPA